MNKIMFNDKYGLTDAVLQGRKTMTRRIVPEEESIRLNTFFGGDDWNYATNTCIDNSSRYDIGEIVAVAQSYKDLGYTKEWVEQHISPNPNAKPTDPFEKKYPGWSNKMFVPAELNNAHRIRITDVKVEKLQGISDEDCYKEGIMQSFEAFYYLRDQHFNTPKEAFAALIDKVSGKGTWEKNPYVFAYSFQLIKEGGAAESRQRDQVSGSSEK